MKRKSELRNKDWRRSSIGDLNEVRSFANPSEIRVYRQETAGIVSGREIKHLLDEILIFGNVEFDMAVIDTRKVKRVKFADPDTAHPINCKPNTSSARSKGTLAQNSDCPKTSEYAFYKKFRENSGCIAQSSPLYKEDNRSDIYEANNRTEELPNVVKHKFGNFSSFLPAVKTAPIEFKLSVPQPQVSKNTEILCKHNEVFAQKRQKLLQCAVESLSLDNNEHHSKGYDLVSALLRRLVPYSGNACTSNNRLALRTKEVELNTKQQLLVSPDSDTHFEELYETPSPNFTLPISSRYLGNGSPGYWSNNSRESIFSLYNHVGPESPLTGHASKVHFEYDRRLLDNIVDELSDITPETEFPLDRYGNLALYHMPMQSRPYYSTQENCCSKLSPYLGPLDTGPSKFSYLKDLDEALYPKESSLGKFSSTRLLGWHYDNSTDEEGLPRYSHSPLLDSYASWKNSGKDCCGDHDSKLDEMGLHSLSLSTRVHDPEFISRDFCLERYPLNGIGWQDLEKKDYEVEKPGNFPVTLLCTPDYVPSAEDNISSSYQISHINSIFRENFCQSLDDLLLSSGINLDFKWKNLSMDGWLRDIISPSHSALHFQKEDIEQFSSPLLLGTNIKRTESTGSSGKHLHRLLDSHSAGSGSKTSKTTMFKEEEQVMGIGWVLLSGKFFSKSSRHGNQSDKGIMSIIALEILDKGISIVLFS
ncbi:hypothetical protein GIB67_024578 [Kingdonia uniflora]|uniref:Uncharacterized protein n=1 Tax=Kingdonia uniflora TaxID=39325 RepID=A0A7J7LNW0_9MAGN|nr:hypothetical protein GIB67_024578 [Kingdonia uniflora]